MTGNANFFFNDVAILSVEAIDAPEVVTSSDIDERLAPFYERTGATPGLLESLAGITARRQWHEGTSFMDAAAMAGEKAIAASGIDRKRIGLMVDSSVCRERLEPSSAVTVHHLLSMPSTCMNFDISNACLGFLNGMHLAGTMLESGQVDYVLVVDGEGTRQIHDNTIDRLNSLDSTLDDMFSNFASLTLGSGSAAMVLGRHSENPGSHKMVGGFFRAATNHHELCVGSLDGMRTDSRGLLEAGTEVAKLAWEDAGERPGWYDMRYYVLHQVSQVHTQAVVDTLGIDSDRLPLSFPTYGNIGPAAIPITLAMVTDTLVPGDGVMLQGMGSGINAAIVEIEW
ncbi:MAG: 3-oxoacyl-[acyl-carrier-protein] synthase III [Verrucomicrobiales bacterium]|jgi:3-oxoacyl-[acyl-carrier-protein] synthase III